MDPTPNLVTPSAPIYTGSYELIDNITHDDRERLTQIATESLATPPKVPTQPAELANELCVEERGLSLITKAEILDMYHGDDATRLSYSFLSSMLMTCGVVCGVVLSIQVAISIGVMVGIGVGVVGTGLTLYHFRTRYVNPMKELQRTLEEHFKGFNAYVQNFNYETESRYNAMKKTLESVRDTKSLKSIRKDIEEIIETMQQAKTALCKNNSYRDRLNALFKLNASFSNDQLWITWSAKASAQNLT